MEKITKRVVADCRKMPGDKNCSLTISGTEEEVLPVAVYHAINWHGHEDTPELHEQTRSLLEEEKPFSEETMALKRAGIDL